MLYGPDASVACPACGAKAKYRNLRSGNTFGATYWTDGKRVAPMLSGPPSFVRCGVCSGCYWLQDVVGEDEDVIPEGAAEAEDLPYVEAATEADMYQALATGQVAGEENERSLRVMAWWLSNDGLRAPHAMPIPSDPSLVRSRQESLRALIPLLKEFDDNDMVMRAEIYRELGDFEAAKGQLDRITDAQFATVVSQLRELCDARDSQVRQLRFEEAG